MRQEYNCLLMRWRHEKGARERPGPFFVAASAVHILLAAPLLAGPTALIVLVLLALLALLALLLARLLARLLLLLMTLGLRILLARLIVLVGHRLLRGWVFQPVATTGSAGFRFLGNSSVPRVSL
jgi:hypothetical protein